MRKVTGVLMAAAMTLTSAAMTAAPARAEVTEDRIVQPKAEKDFLDRTSYLIGLMTEASQAYEIFGSLSDPDARQGGAAARANYWQTRLPQIRQVRATLKGLLAKVDALPPFQSSYGFYNDLAATMITDTRNYLQRVDEMLQAVEELADAVARDNDRDMAIAGVKLRGSIVLLIDGQGTVAKGRQAMLTRQEATWHVMGIYRSLYAGMSTIARVALEGESPTIAAAELRASAKEARVYAREGRARVAIERRAPGAIAAVSNLDDEAMTLGDRIADRLDRLADELKTSRDPATAALAALKDLAVFEERQIAITNEQVRIMNSTRA